MSFQLCQFCCRPVDDEEDVMGEDPDLLEDGEAVDPESDDEDCEDHYSSEDGEDHCE